MQEPFNAPGSPLEQTYAIDTPENVTFAYEVAGIGNRFIAALIDSAIIGVVLTLFTLALFVGLGATGDLTNEGDLSWAGGAVVAAYALISFLVLWGYYIFFEYLWNGQTPGKRSVKIRVVRVDGSPVSFVEVVIRNLVRIVDFLPMGYGLGLVIMFLNSQSRRLGDFAGGTLVVKDQGRVGLETLAQPVSSKGGAEQGRAGQDEAAREALLLEFPAIRTLTPQDYELIRETLHRYDRGQVKQQILLRLARVVAQKLDKEAPFHAGDARSFLDRVAWAYRQLIT